MTSPARSHRFRWTAKAAPAAVAMILALAFLPAADGLAAPAEPIVLEAQGSFTSGGSRLAHDGVFSREHFLAPDGQTAYGDHAYAFYQIPVHARPLPIVFQHGGAQTKRTWESTPDGREGFQNLFLRKGFSVYLIDQPRSGEAGLALKASGADNPYAVNPLYADRTLHELCRIGVFPERFEHSQFPEGPEALEAFQRSWTPYAGELDDDVIADALAAVLEKTGPAILFTHSMGGTIGWRTPFRTDKIRAIVAFEPGGSPFLFPENEVPAPLPAAYLPVSASARGVPLEDFLKLTRIPIVLIYGDNIAAPGEDDAPLGSDKWRSELDMARKFVDAVNRHGGDASLVHLPKIGIRGNTHFLMADLNNAEIADLISKWLHSKQLD